MLGTDYPNKMFNAVTSFFAVTLTSGHLPSSPAPFEELVQPCHPAAPVPPPPTPATPTYSSSSSSLQGGIFPSDPVTFNTIENRCDLRVIKLIILNEITI